MVKVKMCLDAGCTTYFFLEDGRTVHVPNAECTAKIWNDKDRQDFADIVRGTRETILVNRPAMKGVKEGDEVNI